MFNQRFFIQRWIVGKLIARPFEKFAPMETSSGIVLVVEISIAFISPNSSFTGQYYALYHSDITIGIVGKTISRVKGWRHGIGQVSIPCHVNRSMRISRTPLSCWLRAKGYETYRTGRAFGAQKYEKP